MLWMFDPASGERRLMKHVVESLTSASGESRLVKHVVDSLTLQVVRVG